MPTYSPLFESTSGSSDFVEFEEWEPDSPGLPFLDLDTAREFGLDPLSGTFRGWVKVA